MGTKYTTQSTSGYNASPPPDDGSTGENNRITWAKIKTKLSDILKTFSEAINSQIVDWADNSTIAKSSAYTTTLDDNGRTIAVTGTTTITLLAPATATADYRVTVFNAGSNTVTVSGGAATINGASSHTLYDDDVATYATDAAAGDYYITTSSKWGLDDYPTVETSLAGSSTKLASAAAVKNYVDSAASASNILTKIKTVDGAGSGLDADLLDGHSSSYFSTFNVYAYLGNPPSSANSEVSISHNGAGTKPNMLTVTLKCTSDDAGYSTNDEVPVHQRLTSDSGNLSGLNWYFDATNVYVVAGNNSNYTQMVNPSTGQYGNADFSTPKWQVVVRALK